LKPNYLAFFKFYVIVRLWMTASAEPTLQKMTLKCCVVQVHRHPA